MRADDASQAARRVLDAGAMADAWTRVNGEEWQAVPVESPKGTLRSWFVPVGRQNRLLGLFELTPELVPHRCSRFQDRPERLEGCPRAADWLDPEMIRHRSTRLLRAGETAGKPYLSYDRVPSRLAWAVPVTEPSGHQRVVYVAGEAVFDGAGTEESTG